MEKLTEDQKREAEEKLEQDTMSAVMMASYEVSRFFKTLNELAEKAKPIIEKGISDAVKAMNKKSEEEKKII